MIYKCDFGEGKVLNIDLEVDAEYPQNSLIRVAFEDGQDVMMDFMAPHEASEELLNFLAEQVHAIIKQKLAKKPEQQETRNEFITKFDPEI